MKIRKMAIRNYRSLRDVILDDLGDMTFFIGTNKAGKSNLLDAISIFLNEFDPTTVRKIGPVDEGIWFDRTPGRSVEFGFTFELNEIELEDLLPLEILKRIEHQETNILEVQRTIDGNPKSAAWHTKYVKINDTYLIENERFVLKLKREQQSSGPKSPKTEKPFADLSAEILRKISKQLKGRFNLVSATREVPMIPDGVSIRLAALQSEIFSNLSKPNQLWREASARIRKVCRDISDLEVMEGRIARREKESPLYSSMEAERTEYQEVVSLVCQLAAKEKVIFGIREPELRLHPQQGAQTLSILKKISSENQIFVTTHSAAFVDQADLQHVWIFRKKRNETRVFRMKEPTALKYVLNELRLRPSDIFYSDALVFTEDYAERIILPIWARKMNIDLDKLGVSIVPIYGKAFGSYHLAVWMDTAQNLGIPYYFILDKAARDQAEKFGKKLVPKENLFLLQKGSIEEYYPKERLAEALKKEYVIEISEKEKKLESPVEKSVEKLLASKGVDPVGWKIEIGRKVAESMSASEIDDELKTILRNVQRRQEQLSKNR